MMANFPRFGRPFPRFGRPLLTARALSLCVSLAIVGGIEAAADSQTPRMDRSKLLIGAYSFHRVAQDEAHVIDAKACGLDFVLGVNLRHDRKALDLLAKHGIGVIGSGVVDSLWGGDGSNAGKLRTARPKDQYAEQIAAFLSKFDHPAVWMIDLYDEPSALDMPYLGEICSMLTSRAPNMSAYVNLYPNYASVARNTSEQARSQLGTATYQEHVDVYCRTMPLDYISYDFYVYTPNCARRPSLCRQMYENFNVVADACRRTGRSLWYVPQVNSYEAPKCEPTTRNRLRFQAHSAMAFGAEVITWACWAPGWWTNNVLTVKGEKTAQYERLKTVNAELHRLGPVYMRYRSVATHYVGFVATNGLETLKVEMPSRLDTGFFLGLQTKENTPLLVGEMVPRGQDDGSRALFVVASGDPFDVASAVRTVTFRAPEGRKITAFSGNGPVALTHEADGTFTFLLSENAAVMLISTINEDRG